MHEPFALLGTILFVTEKTMQDVITAVVKPRKHFTTAECLYPKGFAEIPVPELLLSEMQYTYTQPAAMT